MKRVIEIALWAVIACSVLGLYVTEFKGPDAAVMEEAAAHAEAASEETEDVSEDAEEEEAAEEDLKEETSEAASNGEDIGLDEGEIDASDREEWRHETDGAGEEDPEEEIEIEYPDLQIDYEWWSCQNEDFLGMLYIPGLVAESDTWKVSEADDGLLYPVVTCSSNNEYLHKSFWTGEYEYRGTIYLDRDASPDMSDLNSFIFGHNMSDKSYFGSLKNFLDESVVEANPYIYLYTAGKVYVYKIFSVDIISTEDSIYYEFYGADISAGTYDEYIEYLLSNSSCEIESGINFSSRPNVLTLSTCYKTGGTQKLLVCAALLN